MIPLLPISIDIDSILSNYIDYFAIHHRILVTKLTIVNNVWLCETHDEMNFN